MNENIHNLDDAGESFEFILKGNTYRMRYPTTEEIEQGDKLKTDAEKTDWLYSFISPVSAESPQIKEALKQCNIKVVSNFNKMIQTEFGG